MATSAYPYLKLWDKINERWAGREDFIEIEAFCTDDGDRFMPNIGKYMINVLKRQSNGRESMDKAWAWKSKAELEATSREHKKRRELNDPNAGRLSRL